MKAVKKILISAFDAGGGNAIFPVAKKISKDNNFLPMFLIGGPSKEIFKKGKIEYIDADLLDAKNLKQLAVDFKPDFFISGTSIGLTFDKKILNEIKKLGVKSIYIIDYWANYRERFSGARKDFKYLPDIICVTDRMMKNEMIVDGFDPRILEITGNPHFDYFQKNIKKNIEKKSTILFLSQPIRKAADVGYDEFKVLDGIAGALSDLGVNFKVIIRPHPREEIGKYDRYISSNIEVDRRTSVENLLSNAGLVIGMASMVLFQAAIAGKKLISFQPDLKAKDLSVHGKFGLGKLATNEKTLKILLGKYFKNDFPKSKKIGKIITPNATENIIKIIKR